jgi:hypothetical protein
MHARRDAKKLHPTDWLEALPPSTLVELMQRRVCVIGGNARADCDVVCEHHPIAESCATCIARGEKEQGPLSVSDIRSIESDYCYDSD